MQKQTTTKKNRDARDAVLYPVEKIPRWSCIVNLHKMWNNLSLYKIIIIKIPFIWRRPPNPAFLIPSKISSNPKKHTHIFQALSTFVKCRRFIYPNSLFVLQVTGKKGKKNLYASCFSIQTHRSGAASELTVITDDSITQWESQRTQEWGHPGLESGRWVVWAVWLHGWMDSWMWKEKNAWLNSAKRNDNGLRGQSLPYMQGMSTWGSGMETTPSGWQLLGICVSSKVRF